MALYIAILQTRSLELIEGLNSILYLTDPDAFASLVLLNRRWRAVSDTPQLYAHHLSRCPSFSLSNNPILAPFQNDDLPRLRRRFAAEVKRNLFEAYLRPRRTTIKLISTSASSSAAFPGGEAFSFSFSPNGHHVLAISSSRIWLINLVTDIISVKREFKISRRPVSATILDDASILAVLSTDHQVNIYDLGHSKVKHVRSVPLDNPPRTITLSPGASVLAAAYDGGIEVYSLASMALPTDRRAVKCDAVDSLAFSNDGTMLLGTTQNSSDPNTVIISAPYYTADGQGASTEDILSQMWTTQILFPSSSRDCSHATLLPHHIEGQANWTFTHDRVFETFRAVRIDDLRNGTTYFTGPKWTGRAGRLLPCTLPAANERGELIAAGFSGNELWLYGIPEAQDSNVHRAQFTGSNTGRVIGPSDADAPAIGPGAPTPPLPLWTQAEQTERARLPQWQVLVDKYRNLFVKGRHVAAMEGLSAMVWVARKGQEENGFSGERLVALAPGGVSTSPEDGSEEPMPVDGGRILILDFERGTRHGESRTITIELGDREPETLEEESRDLETEVAIFRRRTVAMGRGGLAGSPSTRTSTESTQRWLRQNRLTVPGIAPGDQGVQYPKSPVMQSMSNPDTQSTAATSEDILSIEQVQEALDGPYSHNTPRSRLTLYRASTAAATSRRQYSQSTNSSGRAEYRRADGRREIPHESDADNWVPPPPPYTRDPEHPLPQHLQMTLLSHQTEGLRQSDQALGQASSVGTNLEFTTHDAVPDTGSTAERREDMSDLRRRPIRRGVTEPNAGFRQESDQSSQQFDPLRRPVSSLVSPRVEGPPTTFSNTTTPRHDTIRRRPLSAYGDLAASPPGPHRARLTSPISPIPEPLGLERWRSVSTPSSPTHPGPSWTPLMASTGPPPTMDLPQLTLSGPNLQQRLQYPVPPTPTGPQVEISTPSTPPPSQEQQPLPLNPSPAPGVESHAPVHPSAEQLANLQKRYSHGQRRIVPRPVSAIYRRNHAQPVSTPPRAALGATSRSTSPSGDGTLAPARALSRSNSRGSTRSASRRKGQPQRPDYRRLDTIQSVASYISHPTHSRSTSRDLTTAGMPKRVPSRAERSAALNVQAAKRSGRIGGRKKGKGKEYGQNGEEGQAQEWTDVEGHAEHSRTSEVVKKKVAKCIVM